MFTKRFKINIKQRPHAAKIKGCKNTDHRTGKANFDSKSAPQRYTSGGIYKGGLD